MPAWVTLLTFFVIDVRVYSLENTTILLRHLEFLYQAQSLRPGINSSTSCASPIIVSSVSHLLILYSYHQAPFLIKSRNLRHCLCFRSRIGVKNFRLQKKPPEQRYSILPSLSVQISQVVLPHEEPVAQC